RLDELVVDGVHLGDRAPDAGGHRADVAVDLRVVGGLLAAQVVPDAGSHEQEHEPGADQQRAPRRPRAALPVRLVRRRGRRRADGGLLHGATHQRPPTKATKAASSRPRERASDAFATLWSWTLST